MKHFINIFVVLILIGFVLGTTYMCVNHAIEYGWSYLVETIMMFMWGWKLYEDYGR